MVIGPKRLNKFKHVDIMLLGGTKKSKTELVFLPQNYDREPSFLSG
jgi:hypothetical protein